MLTDVLVGLFLFCVLLGMVPTLTTFGQFLVVGLHGVRNHYPKCRDITPRVAFVLPAWNEADVLGSSIDSLMAIDYPAGRGASTWSTMPAPTTRPDVMRAKMAQYPGSVFHLRREKGGQGKAHTLNHGIREILADDWAEGCDDHGRRRAVRGNDLAPHGPAFRRPRDRRRHRLREGGQPAAEPAVALHRLRVHHRPGRGAARAERHGRPAVHGRRCPAAHPREPAGDRWRHRHQHARRGHLHHHQDPARRSARPVRRQRRRLGRGARQRRRAVEAARALGAVAICRSPRPFAICGSGPTAVRCSATFPSACCGSASP